MKFSDLFEMSIEIEKSIIHESTIENLLSLMPIRIPPEEPKEGFDNQKFILLLNAFNCLLVNDSFLVSCIATKSILCVLIKSLRTLRLLGRPNPLAF